LSGGVRGDAENGRFLVGTEHFGDEWGGWMGLELLGAVHLEESPFLKDGDAALGGEGILGGMSDE
jgi:hypothetical protein